MHQAPLGPLCRYDGTPLEIQPVARLVGPDPISKESVKDLLNSTRTASLKVGRLMDRMLLTFRRNRLNGRPAKRYNAAEPDKDSTAFTSSSSSSSFPLEWKYNRIRPGISVPGSRFATFADLRPSAEERFHGYKDQVPYKSSSEEDNESDWDREDVADEGRGRRIKKGGPDVRRSSRKVGEHSAISAINRQTRLIKRQERTRFVESEGDSADTDEENVLEMYGSDENEERLTRKRVQKKQGVKGPARGRKCGPKTSYAQMDNPDIEYESAPTVTVKRIPKNVNSMRWTVPVGTEIDREWLQAEQQVAHQYCPQMGDRVVYFPQGHSALLSEFPARDRLLPWNSFNDRYPVVECEVRDIKFEFPPFAELRRCKSVVAAITLVILRTPDKWRLHAQTGTMQVDLAVPRVSRHKGSAEHVFTVDIRNWDEIPDFIVPFHLFEKALKCSWRAGMHISADYKATDEEMERTGKSVVQYKGTIAALSESSPDWSQSPWESLEVLWDTGDEQRLGPWEATLISENRHQTNSNPSLSAPHIDTEEALRIEREIGTLMNERESDFNPFEFPVDSNAFTDYYSIVRTVHAAHNLI